MKHTVYIRFTATSTIEIDPCFRDAQKLKRYATRTLGKPEWSLAFPEEDFDWDGATYGANRVKFKLKDIDRYSRNPGLESEYLPECLGIIYLTLTEMNAKKLYGFQPRESRLH